MRYALLIRDDVVEFYIMVIGETFVTRKITREVAKIHWGHEECFELGNLDSKRDWGHAKDYVLAMWMMLQQDQPDDFVISTGEVHSVREFVEAAFAVINRKIRYVFFDWFPPGYTAVHFADTYILARFEFEA